MSNKKIRLNKYFKMRVSTNDDIGVHQKKSTLQNMNFHIINCNKEILSPAEDELKRFNCIKGLKLITFNLSDITECLEYIEQFPRKSRSKTLFYPKKCVLPVYFNVLSTNKNITDAVSQMETNAKSSNYLSPNINKSPSVKHRNFGSNTANIFVDDVNVPHNSHEDCEKFQVDSCRNEINIDIYHEETNEHEQSSAIQLSQDDGKLYMSQHLFYPQKSASAIYDVFPTSTNMTTTTQLETSSKRSDHLFPDLNNSAEFKSRKSKSNTPNISFDDANVQYISYEDSELLQVSSCQDESIVGICLEKANKHEQSSTLHPSQDDSNIDNDRSAVLASPDKSILKSFDINNDFDKNLPSIVFQEKSAQEILHDDIQNNSFEKSFSEIPYKIVSGQNISHELRNNSGRSCFEHSCKGDIIGSSIVERSNHFERKSETLPKDENAQEITDRELKNISLKKSFSEYVLEDRDTLVMKFVNGPETLINLKNNSDRSCHLHTSEDEIFINSSNKEQFNNFEGRSITTELVTYSEETSTTPLLQEDCVTDICIEQGVSFKKGSFVYPSGYVKAKDFFAEEPKIDLPKKNHSELTKGMSTTDITREERNKSESSPHSFQDTVMHICHENIEGNSNEKVTGSAKSSPELHSQDFHLWDVSNEDLQAIINSVSLVKTRDSLSQHITKHKHHTLDIYCSSEPTSMITSVPTSPVSGYLLSSNKNDCKSDGRTNFYAARNEIFIQKNYSGTEDNVSDISHNHDMQSVPVIRNSTEENKSVEFPTYDDIIKAERAEDVILISSNHMLKKKNICNKRKLMDEGSLQKYFRRKHSEYGFHSIDTVNTEQEIRVISKETCSDILECVPSNSDLNLSPSSVEMLISPEKCNPECTFPKYVSSEDLIFQLLNWDTDWLRIQLETNRLPPIILDDCKEVKKCYKSVEEYYDTYFPLNLLNIWLSMFKSWKMCPNAIHYDAKFEDLEENAHCMRISCSTIMTSNEFKGFPKHGGMVIVTFTKADGHFEKLFGYIDDVKKQAYIPSQDNETFRKISWEKVKFSFYTAEKPSENVQEFIKVQNLLNIKNLLNQNDALKSLETSTMKDIILNPEFNKSKLQIVSCSSSSTFQKLQDNVNKILNNIFSEGSQVILVHTSIADRAYAVFRIAQGIIKKHCSVLVCFKDEKVMLMIATYLAEFGIILAVRESEVAVPDYLKKFVLNERIAQKAYDGCSRERIRYEVFKDCSIVLTILSSMNLKDVSDTFFDGNLVCVLDEANLCYESETMLLLSYNLRKMVLMSNFPKQVEAHPFLQMYGYEKSLYSRLFKIKCRE